jgi:hypothetical protein
MSFNLATSVSELRGSEYVNRRVIQVPATREINNGNFFRSDQTFRWNIAGNSWWSPAQSYFRIRSTLTGPGGAPLKGSDNIAPAFCFMDCMYRSASFSMNGIRVSQITDYMPQIASLKNRHGKSRDYRQGVGNSLAFYDTDFYRRQARVIVDGKNDETEYKIYTASELNVAPNTVQLVSIAGRIGTLRMVVTGAGANNPLLLSGDIVYFNIPVGAPSTITTQLLRVTRIRQVGAVADTSVSLFDVEGLLDNVTPITAGAVAATDANFRVKRAFQQSERGAGAFETVWCPPLGITELSTFLPAGQYEYNFQPQQLETALKLCIESLGADKVSGTDFTLTMDSIEFYCVTVEQARVDSLDYLIDLKEMSCVPFTITNSNWTSNMLIVPPSTTRLTVAYQDTQVSTGTQFPVSKFVVENSVQDLITRFNLTYANVVYPSNDLDLKALDASGVVPRTQRFTQAYNDMLLANGSAFSDTSSETLLEWLNNGFYLSYPTVKESKDTSTQVMIKQEFSAAVPNTQLLLFASYGTITSVSIKSGQVVSVSTVEA